VVGGGLCGGFGAGRVGGVWGLLLGGEAGVRGAPDDSPKQRNRQGIPSFYK
jgi:hypothetical protein